jgi:hypothetical protein
MVTMKCVMLIQQKLRKCVNVFFLKTPLYKIQDTSTATVQINTYKININLKNANIK